MRRRHISHESRFFIAEIGSQRMVYASRADVRQFFIPTCRLKGRAVRGASWAKTEIGSQRIRYASRADVRQFFIPTCSLKGKSGELPGREVKCRPRK